MILGKYKGQHDPSNQFAFHSEGLWCNAFPSLSSPPSRPLHSPHHMCQSSPLTRLHYTYLLVCSEMETASVQTDILARTVNASQHVVNTKPTIPRPVNAFANHPAQETVARTMSANHRAVIMKSIRIINVFASLGLRSLATSARSNATPPRMRSARMQMPGNVLMASNMIQRANATQSALETMNSIQMVNVDAKTGLRRRMDAASQFALEKMKLTRMGGVFARMDSLKVMMESVSYQTA
jgi:hypothetical protein